MAGRFRVTGVLGDDHATYALTDLTSGQQSGSVEIGELTVTITLKGEAGEQLAQQRVSLPGLDALSFQKALRRFLAEERPGDDYHFEEVADSEMAITAELMLGGDYDEDEDDDDEYEE